MRRIELSPGIVPSREIQERSFSLTDSLCAVASAAGSPLSRDDLHAAMGLPFMICVPHDDSISPRDWPLLARDVFLVEAGRMFGLGIREVHPPEAAIGLDHMAVFRQHFEASYRPLVARALENGQHVLAWQGWPGEDGHLWGVIQSVDDNASGLGISGSTGPALRDGLSTATSVPFSEPPVQLYVVETTAATAPGADDLWETVRHQARHALANECGARFAATTGPEAIDRWIDRLRLLDVGDANFAPSLVEHHMLARELVAGFHSGIRFLKQQVRVSTDSGEMIPHLIASCQKAATALASFAKTAIPATGGDNPDPRDTLIRQLTDTRAAMSELLTLLSK